MNLRLRHLVLLLALPLWSPGGADAAPKSKKTPSTKSQSKGPSSVSKQEYIKAAAGKQLEIGKPMVLTATRPAHDAWNKLEVYAADQMWYLPEAGTDGRIRLKRGGDHNHIRLEFRLAANQQYLIDCLVAPTSSADPARSIALEVPTVRGTATVQDGHALRYIPAKPEARSMVGFLMGKDDTGIEVTRCEISPLS